MIDIENELYDLLAQRIRAEYPDANITSTYVPSPAEFPAVSIEMMDNVPYRNTQDSSTMEHDVDNLFEINVMSNKTRGKKAECKAIAALIDGAMLSLGFNRSYMRPTQNLLNVTVYQITARYQAVVSADKTIYRR